MHFQSLRTKAPRFIALLTVLAAMLGAAQSAQALPQWAIEYNVRCTTCHALIYPKLNSTGYLFERLGFRLPAAVLAGTPGPVAPGTRGVQGTRYDLIDYLSFAADASYVLQNPTYKSSTVDTSGGFQFNNASLYAAGPLPEGFAFYMQEGLGPSTPSLSSAFVQYDKGSPNSLFTLKAGQFSKFESIGPFSGSILSGGIGTGQTINDYSPGGAERGVQLGYTYKQATSAMISLFNGVADNAGSGSGTSLTGTPQDTNTAKDVMFQAFHFFDKEGSSVGGFYYHGDTWVTASTAANDFTDDFFTAGVSANYFVTPRLNIQGDYVRGNHDVPVTASTRTRLNNEGYQAEADYGLDPFTVVVARYDAEDQQTTGFFQQASIGAAHSFMPFTKFTLEWQNRWGYNLGADSVSQTYTADFQLDF